MAISTDAILFSGDGLTATNGALNFFKVVWSPMIQKELDNESLFANLVDRSFESMAQGTKEIRVPRLGAVSTRRGHTDDHAVPNSGVTDSSSITININETLAARVDISDYIDLQDGYDLMALYTGEIGRSMAEKLDRELAEDMTVGDNTAKVFSLAASPSYTTFLDVLQYFAEEHTPMGNRMIVVNPSTANRIMQIQEFRHSDYTSVAGQVTGDIVADSLVARPYGVPVYVSNHIYSSSSSRAQDNTGSFAAADRHDAIAANEPRNPVWQKDYFTLVLQHEFPMETMRLEDNFATQMRAHLVFGDKVMRPQFGAALVTA